MSEQVSYNIPIRKVTGVCTSACSSREAVSSYSDDSVRFCSRCNAERVAVTCSSCELRAKHVRLDSDQGSVRACRRCSLRGSPLVGENCRDWSTGSSWLR
eukprot:436955-Pyramimonas_sp.AAC.2